MEDSRFTLDTNIILYLFQGRPGPSQLLSGKESLELYTSIITKTELLSFPDITPEEYNWLVGFLDDAVEVVPYTDEIVSIAIDFRRKTKRKLPDSIVAATAIHVGTPLVTCDKELSKVSFPNFKVVIPEI